MSEPGLLPRPALAQGWHTGGLRLEERAGRFAALALPVVSAAAAEAALAAHLGPLPAPGQSAHAPDGSLVMRLGAEMWMLWAEAAVDWSGLERVAYLTDQSDVWTALHLAGSDWRTRLALACPLDLHPRAFPEGAATRTAMGHLSAILWAGPEGLMLWTPRSSVGDFAEHLRAAVCAAD